MSETADVHSEVKSSFVMVCFIAIVIMYVSYIKLLIVHDEILVSFMLSLFGSIQDASLIYLEENFVQSTEMWN